MEFKDFTGLIEELSVEWNVVFNVRIPEVPQERLQFSCIVYFNNCPLIDYSSFCKSVYEIVTSRDYPNYYIIKMMSDHNEDTFSICWEEK